MEPDVVRELARELVTELPPVRRPDGTFVSEAIPFQILRSQLSLGARRIARRVLGRKRPELEEFIVDRDRTPGQVTLVLQWELFGELPATGIEIGDGDQVPSEPPCMSGREMRTAWAWVTGGPIWPWIDPDTLGQAQSPWVDRGDRTHRCDRPMRPRRHGCRPGSP